jgi:ABC transporter, permease/ATP-binding protein
MIYKIKNIYGLTTNGAKDLIIASITSFFLYFSYMMPIILIMYFSYYAIENQKSSSKFYIIGIIVISLTIYFIAYINYNILYTVTYKESANLRIEIANILKDLPLSFFSKNESSDLSQTIMKDIADIEHALSHAIPQAVGFILYLILVSIILVIGNLKLGLCVIIPIYSSLLLQLLSKKLQVKSSKKYYKKLRDNSKAFQESIEMQQEIKSYGKQKQIKSELIKKIDESEKIHIISELGQSLPTNFSSTVVRFTLGITILYGSLLYSKGQIQLLYLVFYVVIGAKLISDITNLHMNIAEIMHIDARVEKINQIRNANKQTGKKLNITNYDIELKNVNFSYDDTTQVIKNISFVAKQGQITALVGSSGCGKTTILRLISRLYDYDNGLILIDNKDIKDIDTSYLFEKISIVFQDVILFNTSIMENIRIGKKNASDEEVIQAAKKANCDDFVDNLKDKYDTIIGENGSKLSGGQRQRISIARAILKNSPIILLDEISASLDVENEMKIQQSLNTLIKDKTVIIVSHRLKSIENADKIIVMDNGKIDSIGTHKELLEKSQIYKQMIEMSNISQNYTY